MHTGWRQIDDGQIAGSPVRSELTSYSLAIEYMPHKHLQFTLMKS